VQAGRGIDFAKDVAFVAASPWYGAVVFLWLALTLRRVLYRLDDKGG
jgi:hypothetical protein